MFIAFIYPFTYLFIKNLSYEIYDFYKYKTCHTTKDKHEKIENKEEFKKLEKYKALVGCTMNNLTIVAIGNFFIALFSGAFCNSLVTLNALRFCLCIILVLDAGASISLVMKAKFPTFQKPPEKGIKAIFGIIIILYSGYFAYLILSNNLAWLILMGLIVCVLHFCFWVIFGIRFEPLSSLNELRKDV